MASHHSDSEDDEVSNQFYLFDSDAQGIIDELLNEWKILYKTISSQKKQISSLEEKCESMEKDLKDEKQKLVSKNRILYAKILNHSLSKLSN